VGVTRVRAALDTVLLRALRVQLRGTVKERRAPNDDMFLGVRHACEG
jgi:hypothetical protein